jgi:hypothetical protein
MGLRLGTPLELCVMNIRENSLLLFTEEEKVTTLNTPGAFWVFSFFLFLFFFWQYWDLNLGPLMLTRQVVLST